jgi:hypothetical protein
MAQDVYVLKNRPTTSVVVVVMADGVIASTPVKLVLACHLLGPDPLPSQLLEHLEP